MKVDGRDPFFSFLVRVVPSLLDEEKRETVASGRRLWFMGLISTNLQYKRLLVWFYAGTGGRSPFSQRKNERNQSLRNVLRWLSSKNRFHSIVRLAKSSQTGPNLERRERKSTRTGSWSSIATSRCAALILTRNAPFISKCLLFFLNEPNVHVRTYCFANFLSNWFRQPLVEKIT